MVWQVLVVNHSVDFFKRMRAIRRGMELSAGNAASSLQMLRSQARICASHPYYSVRYTHVMPYMLTIKIMQPCVRAQMFAKCRGVQI